MLVRGGRRGDASHSMLDDRGAPCWKDVSYTTPPLPCQETVVLELAELFPDEYLHIGGDETFFTYVCVVPRSGRALTRCYPARHAHKWWSLCRVHFGTGGPPLVLVCCVGGCGPLNPQLLGGRPAHQSLQKRQQAWQ